MNYQYYILCKLRGVENYASALVYVSAWSRVLDK